MKRKTEQRPVNAGSKANRRANEYRYLAKKTKKRESAYLT